jgi:hypothetical protein
LCEAPEKPNKTWKIAFVLKFCFRRPKNENKNY